ncbi:MAG: DUF6941 family protein [Planctomycetota bacterium]|jgi:hypothetical protein
MGKKNNEKRKGLPPPILLTAVVCDTAIIDALTNKVSIIGIFENLAASKYPVRHPAMTFVCQLTNGRGKMPIEVRIVDVENDEEILFKRNFEVAFTDVRKVENIIFGIRNFMFPHPGEFRLQVVGADDLLGERRIICRKISIPAGGAKNEK